MAKEIIVRLKDDMEPDQIAAETIHFALDGSGYTIDLSEKNAAKLRAALQPFIDHARKEGRIASPAKKGGVRVASRDDLDAIRAWAQSVGKTVSDRGRVAQSIQDEYDEAMSAKSEPAPTATKATRKPTAEKKEDANAQEPAFSAP